jgi:hypothetical protein
VRLIDADAFKQELKENYTFYGFVDLLNDFYVAIDKQPTIEPKTKVIAQFTFDEDKLREIVHEAVERIKEEYDIVDNPDAVSVVRCKECRYCKRKRGTFKGEPIIFYRCEENNRDVDSDDFCSYGEREGER